MLFTTLNVKYIICNNANFIDYLYKRIVCFKKSEIAIQYGKTVWENDIKWGWTLRIEAKTILDFVHV